ncbi:phage tail protein [Sphingomicrobium aestuariivivum]|uniref:phage tail protein n=1 Tax=Sphingomicrobium aestuariivivum TaxID=1582356 RepID=UPI001FD6BE58|nr:phage tail protein [Sphingomicrobium aestuariivivum]MCJ8191784.1 phage tail protein [Sphingomicrobium aestuariivivum]
MATLVFSSVGQAVAGPLGSAIGALVGQHIDQRLFGSGASEGPRLGELSVQGSRYGAVVPAVYGRMRVAGTIIWATDLVESQAVTGTKGQPQRTIYSYSANFAVALSSRPGGRVGRIWADGNLLRGADGHLKVPGELRVHAAGESQEVDPLLGALETAVPAYRDLMIAVFEGLELADFGNRIPMLTFEIVADEALDAGKVLDEASNGLIAVPDVLPIDGYAVHGQSLGTALAPLIELAALDLVDAGSRLETGEGVPRMLDFGDLASGNGKPGELPTDTLSSATDLPLVLHLDHFDPDRDYQVSRSQARAGSGGRALKLAMPVTLSALRARLLAEDVLLRTWRERRSLRVDLPMRYLDLQPGDLIGLPDQDGYWRVVDVVLERLVVRVSAVAHVGKAKAIELPTDGGRHLPSRDLTAAPTEAVLVELPDLEGDARTAVVVATANSSSGWRAVPLEVAVGSGDLVISSAAREGVIGQVSNVIGAAPRDLVDMVNVIEVDLVDADHDLLSITRDRMLQGGNLAMVGDEVIQFERVEAIAPGRIRLSSLLRGRFASDDAIDGHQAGEAFVLLDRERLARIDLVPEQQGTLVSVRPAGLADEDAAEVSIGFAARAARPPSPTHLTGQRVGGGLELNWVRRSRRGYAWLDHVDVPLGETAERYHIELSGTAGAVTLTSDRSDISVASEALAPLGTGQITVACRMLGDTGMSTATTITID